ncbi:MAG: hypothetical protein AAGD92_15150 [Pseudomonadota bacterium]
MAYDTDKNGRVPDLGHRDASGELGSLITGVFERYAHLLEDADLTEEQKRKICEAVWGIVFEFVSLGFRVHPLQLAQNACGKPQETAPKSPLTAPDALYLDHSFLAENFDEFAEFQTDPAQKDSSDER